MDWELLKKNYRVKTTEELFYIDEAPTHQCPSIDNICQAISNIESTVNGSKYDHRDSEERLEDVDYEVRGLEDSVNQVRESVEHLRNWGQEWKDLTKRIIEQFNLNIDEIR